jgi:hypothetical protein
MGTRHNSEKIVRTDWVEKIVVPNRSSFSNFLGRLADLHQATRRSGCLFNHLVGEREQLVRNLEAERLRGLEIDD